MARLQPGQLDQLVTLKHKSLSADGKGGSASTYTTYATNVPARITPLRGSERVGSQRVEAMGGYLVELRNRSDLVESDVIVWQSRSLNIRFIRDRSTRVAYLSIETELGVAV